MRARLGPNYGWCQDERGCWGALVPKRGFGGSQGMPRAVQLGNSACKCKGKAGARFGQVSRREGLLGGSRAREGVRRLPGYTPSCAIGHLGTQVRRQG